MRRQRFGDRRRKCVDLDRGGEKRGTDRSPEMVRSGPNGQTERWSPRAGAAGSNWQCPCVPSQPNAATSYNPRTRQTTTVYSSPERSNASPPTAS